MKTYEIFGFVLRAENKRQAYHFFCFSEFKNLAWSVITEESLNTSYACRKYVTEITNYDNALLLN